jgi:hypothetical protein
MKGLYKFDQHDSIFNNKPYIHAKNVSGELDIGFVKNIFQQRAKVSLLEKVGESEYRIFPEDISEEGLSAILSLDLIKWRGF